MESFIQLKTTFTTQKVYGILDYQQLTLYDSLDVVTHQPKHVRLTINIKDCIVWQGMSKDKFTIKIYKNTNPLVKFYCYSQLEYNNWYKVLLRAINIHNESSDHLALVNKHKSILLIDPAVMLDKKLLTTAYKKLSLQTHPDRGGNTEEFNKIKSSYDYLKQLLEEEIKRKHCTVLEYDVIIKKGPIGIGCGLKVAEDKIRKRIIIDEILEKIEIIAISDDSNGSIQVGDAVIRIDNDDCTTWPITRIPGRMNDARLPIGVEVHLTLERRIVNDNITDDGEVLPPRSFKISIPAPPAVVATPSLSQSQTISESSPSNSDSSSRYTPIDDDDIRPEDISMVNPAEVSEDPIILSNDLSYQSESADDEYCNHEAIPVSQTLSGQASFVIQPNQSFISVASSSHSQQSSIKNQPIIPPQPPQSNIRPPSAAVPLPAPPLHHHLSEPNLTQQLPSVLTTPQLHRSMTSFPLESTVRSVRQNFVNLDAIASPPPSAVPPIGALPDKNNQSYVDSDEDLASSYPVKPTNRVTIDRAQQRLKPTTIPPVESPSPHIAAIEKLQKTVNELENQMLHRQKLADETTAERDALQYQISLMNKMIDDRYLDAPDGVGKRYIETADQLKLISHERNELCKYIATYRHLQNQSVITSSNDSYVLQLLSSQIHFKELNDMVDRNALREKYALDLENKLKKALQQ